MSRDAPRARASAAARERRSATWPPASVSITAATASGPTDATATAATSASPRARPASIASGTGVRNDSPRSKRSPPATRCIGLARNSRSWLLTVAASPASIDPVRTGIQEKVVVSMIRRPSTPASSGARNAKVCRMMSPAGLYRIAGVRAPTRMSQSRSVFGRGSTSPTSVTPRSCRWRTSPTLQSRRRAESAVSTTSIPWAGSVTRGYLPLTRVLRSSIPGSIASCTKCKGTVRSAESADPPHRPTTRGSASTSRSGDGCRSRVSSAAASRPGQTSDLGPSSALTPGMPGCVAVSVRPTAGVSSIWCCTVAVRAQSMSGGTSAATRLSAATASTRNADSSGAVRTVRRITVAERG